MYHQCPISWCVQRMRLFCTFGGMMLATSSGGSSRAGRLLPHKARVLLLLFTHTPAIVYAICVATDWPAVGDWVVATFSAAGNALFHERAAELAAATLTAVEALGALLSKRTGLNAVT